MARFHFLITLLFFFSRVEAADCASSVPTITRTGATVCEGKQGSISINGTGGSTYMWFNGSTSASVNVTANVPTYYQVTIYYNDSCSVMDSVLLNVNSNPTVVGIGESICTGETARITATGALTYNWGIHGNTQFINVKPIADQNYSVTGTDANGCTAVSFATVTIKPGISATAVGDTICEGDVAFLSIVDPPVGFTYNWGSLGQGTSVTAAPLVNSLYKVIATGTNGCTVEATAFVYVSKKEPVSLDFNFNSICRYDSPMPLNGIPAGGYMIGPGVFGSKFFPDSAGVGRHSITYYYTNPLGGCMDSSSKSIVVLQCDNSIAAATGIRKVSVFPSPFILDFNLSVESEQSGFATIQLHDAAGNLKYESALELRMNDLNQLNINIPDLSHGLYILSIQRENQIVKLKLLKN